MGYSVLPTNKIVLCTRNGGRFLGAQLQSFVDQTHQDWELWVSDDGSTDDTRDQIADFARAHPNRKIALLAGPGQGSAANFLFLLSHNALAGSWVAIADQDDVWMPHKLSRAAEVLMASMSRLEAGRSAIYASRTVHTDPKLEVTGLSPLHLRPYGFGNALVQNVLGGNTIVMPPDTTDLIRATLPAARAADVPFHDWWIYLVTTGAGVEVINDPEPGLYYRQHGGNEMGSSTGNRRVRLKMLRDREYASWIDRNLAALRRITPLLSAENLALLSAFEKWRATPAVLRLRSPQALGLYRQTTGGNMVLRALARTGHL